MNFIFPESKAARQSSFEELAQKYKDIDIFSLGKSILGEDINCVRIGRGNKNIISVAAHHGMEYISAAALFDVILKFAENLTRSRTYYEVNLSFLLQNFTFWFVPCLNPDGVDLAISGAMPNPLYDRQIRMNGSLDFSSWQANARGVDLNHNYDFRFFEYKRIEEEQGILPGKTRYSGEYPESEPETAALLKLIRTISPELIISLHTQGEEVFFRPRKSKKAFRLAKTAAEILDYKLSAPEGLADYGGLSDFAGEVLGIPSLTIELGKGENPLPKSQLPAIAERLLKLHVLLPTLM